MLNNPLNTEPQTYANHFFIGQVVDNNDPQKLERVKCVVPGLYEGSAEDLPWIAPATARGFANKTGQGVFCVPSIGTYLHIVLQQGNPHYPLYIGSPVQTRADLPEADVNYPHRYGFKDPRGNLFYVDTTPGINEVFFRHASGTQFRINNNGSIDLTAVATITSQAPQWNHTGNMEITGNIVQNGNQTINGNEQVNGTVDASAGITSQTVVTGVQDVMFGGISGVTHAHSGVDTGSGVSGPPVG